MAPRTQACFGALALLAACATACGGTHATADASGAAAAGGVIGTGASGATAGTTGAAGTTGGAGGTIGGAGRTTGDAGAGTGGAAEATGSGGTTDGGTTDGGGAGPIPPIDAVWKGPGCGKPLPANQPASTLGRAGGFLQFHVTTTGATLAGAQPAKAGDRSFWVRVPPSYDPQTAFRTIYTGLSCDSKANVNGGSALPFAARETATSVPAILVAIDTPNDTFCYDTDTGSASVELEAFALVHAAVDAAYCVDDNRIFVSGMFSGGALANVLGCYFSGPSGTTRAFAPRVHVRAQASLEGTEPPMLPPCGGPVAAIWYDNTQGPTNNTAARDRVLQMNGCGHAMVPFGASAATLGCTRFTDCPADYPVVYCGRVFGRTDHASDAATAFMALFDLLSPAP